MQTYVPRVPDVQPPLRPFVDAVSGILNSLIRQGLITMTGVGEWEIQGQLTGADILALLAPVDGAGSGLDADTIDGLDSTELAGGNLAIGAEVTDGTPTLVLYVGVGGLLAQDPNFAWNGSTLTLTGGLLATSGTVPSAPPEGQIHGPYLKTTST